MHTGECYANQQPVLSQRQRFRARSESVMTVHNTGSKTGSLHSLTKGCRSILPTKCTDSSFKSCCHAVAGDFLHLYNRGAEVVYREGVFDPDTDSWIDVDYGAVLQHDVPVRS